MVWNAWDVRQLLLFWTYIYFQRDSNMNLWMSGLIYWSEEDRSKAEVTHLALARSQNTRNGILGFYKRIKSCKSKTYICVWYKR